MTYCCCSSHDSRLLLLLLWLLSWWRCGWCNYRRSTSPPLPLFPDPPPRIRQSCPGPFLPLISPSIPFPPLPSPTHTYPSLPSLTSLCPLPSCQLPENVAQRKSHCVRLAREKINKGDATISQPPGLGSPFDCCMQAHETVAMALVHRASANQNGQNRHLTCS